MGRRPSPIDVDDLLAEILLRLPALPSSLPRASLVCTRWRRIVTDPDFLRRFRARHWKPLGVFLTSQLHIVQLDFGSQNLAVIEVPSDVYANHRGLCLTTLANGGGLSLMVMAANLRAQLWERAPDSDGTARWMLGGTIELDKLLSLRPGFPECRAILGVEGDHNVMFVSTYRGVFMVHLESMQFEKIFKTNPFIDGGTIHPFTTLHAPGTC
ncbi:unnamed protein product [Urochloa decumbens]|uniref:F-box domain-containing protein n=1 Tax=Urochloa decumbens TaxID=240449 RepID=A0ABC8W8K2_9POAL